jgi:hypothetical protein
VAVNAPVRTPIPLRNQVMCAPTWSVCNRLFASPADNNRFKKMQKSADPPGEISYINTLEYNHTVAARRRTFQLRQRTGWLTLLSRPHGQAVALFLMQSGR